MTATRVGVTAGEPRAHVDLVVGALAPRLIHRTETAAEVVLTAAGMVLLGGDRVHIDIRVGAGCTLDVVDVGGTVAYPSRGVASEWHVDVLIAAHGLLRWHGLPFVVAEGADVARRTSISLGSCARAVLRDTVVLGRHGETGGRLVSTLEASDDGGPVLVETVDVAGGGGEPGVLGAARVLDTVTALGFRPDAAPGDLVLDRPGALARRLVDAAHETTLAGTWARWAAAAEVPANPVERVGVPAGRSAEAVPTATDRSGENS